MVFSGHQRILRAKRDEGDHRKRRSANKVLIWLKKERFLVDTPFFFFFCC
jgi:hypothetical protein